MTVAWTVGIFITDVSCRETYCLCLVRCEERDSGRVEQPTHFGMFRVLNRRGVEFLCWNVRHELCIAACC